MKRDNLKYLCLSALFSALVYLFCTFLSFPIVSGGYVHLADGIIYIALSILPRRYGFLATLGAFAADLFSAPVYAPFTLIIKALFILAFTSGNDVILCRKNKIAPLFGIVITVAGYAVADSIIFGSVKTALVSALMNLIQGVASAVIYYVVAAALDKMSFKKYIERL